MPSAGKSAAAPLYLLACLIFGGSTQGAWENAVLQLAGIAIIAWSAAVPAGAPLARPARFLLLLLAVAILLVALQLVPLPPTVWAHGARMQIADDYHLLGRPAPWLPLSLTPYDTLACLLQLIPPLALFCAIVRLKAYRSTWLGAALLAGATAGIVLGAMQLASGGGNSHWYPYSETNPGLAVGFFANANQMASLLLISLPFLSAMAATNGGQDIPRRLALIMVLAGLGLVLIVGIALDGSLAGYTLAVPVLAASAMILLPKRSVLRWLAVAFAILILLGAVIALASSSVGSTRIGRDASTSVQSRLVILKTTATAISDYLPLGSGLGSFLKVYRLYERPASVTREYVIHAHDDYAELALELGVPGIILMLIFLGWWVAAVTAVWRKGEGSSFTRAASIASAAILVHSLVDFPLRTAAISACFAMCLALLADRRKPPPREITQLRPARHVTFS